jgi:FkbM family methyltransferase
MGFKGMKILNEQAYTDVYDEISEQLQYSLTSPNQTHLKTMHTTIKKYQHLFKCPNCRSTIAFFDDNGASGFYCKNCSRVFPVKEGVAIILADDIRNYSLEYPQLSDMLDTVPNSAIKRYLEETIALVESKKESRSWEWDDEEFWSTQYRKQADRQEEKNRNNRYWQRQPLVKTLLKNSSLEGKIVLSIGCGDGNNFRKLILPHCNETSLYISTDISFHGLALNKRLNPHTNSIYVLCSEDYELPFEDESLDVICYFGVLHHTRLKSMNIVKDRRVLKLGGFILLHEAIDRPETFIAKHFDEEKSAHEEYVNRNELLNLFREDTGFKILYKREDLTPFYTFFMIFFKEAMLTHKKFFDCISFVDALIAKTLGSLFPIFKAGCIGLTARVVPKEMKPLLSHVMWVPFADLIGLIARTVIPKNLILRIPQGTLKGHKWVVASGPLEYYIGCYESAKTRLIEAYIQEGRVFYDLGAHVGYFTLLAALLVKESGHVVSFEPNPDNIKHLKRHIYMNNYSNVKVIEAAVSNVDGFASFNNKRESSTGKLSLEGNIQVVTRTIDTLVGEGEIPPPDYMKIDVEGSEAQVLRGALKTIEKYGPTIFLSTHGEHMKEECITLLGSISYTVRPEPGECITEASELLAFK